jgi:hypothetical protein
LAAGSVSSRIAKRAGFIGAFVPFFVESVQHVAQIFYPVSVAQ